MHRHTGRLCEISLELTPTEGGGLAIRIEIPLVLAPAHAPVPQELELDGELRVELKAVS